MAEDSKWLFGDDDGKADGTKPKLVVNEKVRKPFVFRVTCWKRDRCNY
jgi:hypothetical protein